MVTKLFAFSIALYGLCMQAPAQNSLLTFSGKVTNQAGQGIAGVVVNDGVHFTQTNQQGMWTLATDTVVSKFVSISTPSAYQLPQHEGLAQGFYVSVGQLATQGNKHDFVLNKRKTSNPDFYYIAVSDPQVRNAREMKRWRQDIFARIFSA